MQLSWHDGIESFLQETLEHLEREEARHNLLLGLALILQEHPDAWDEVFLVTVRAGRDLAAAGLMTVPANLILYTAPGVDLEETLSCLTNGFLEGGIALPGVTAPAAVCQRFAALWAELTGCRAELEMPMRLYELRQVTAGVIGEGSLRLAREEDLDFVIGAIASFERDAGLNSAPDLERIGRLARRLVARRGLYLWEHGDKIVSMAAKTRPTRHGISINHVYTPQGLRRRGYATSCVAALCQLLLDEGYQFCTLFADLNNPTSNSIYQRIGFRPIGDFAGYTFGSDGP